MLSLFAYDLWKEGNIIDTSFPQHEYSSNTAKRYLSLVMHDARLTL